MPILLQILTALLPPKSPTFRYTFVRPVRLLQALHIPSYLEPPALAFQSLGPRRLKSDPPLEKNPIFRKNLRLCRELWAVLCAATEGHLLEALGLRVKSLPGLFPEVSSGPTPTPVLSPAPVVKLQSKHTEKKDLPDKESAFTNDSLFIQGTYRWGATRTGRLSCKEPNLMCLPPADRRRLVSRFGSSHGLLLEFDFKRLELWMVAGLSGEYSLVERLRRGEDFKTWLEWPVQDSSLKNKIFPRTLWKKIAFQRLYGASPRRLAATLQMPTPWVKRWLKREKEKFPRVEAFFQSFSREVHRWSLPLQRVLTSERAEKEFSRSKEYIGRGTLPTGRWFRFEQRNYRFPEPRLRNYPIQGLGAEFSLAAGDALLRHLYRQKFYQGEVFWVNFVHDSFLLDLRREREAEVRKAVGDLLRAVGDPQGWAGMFPELEWGGGGGVQVHVRQPGESENEDEEK